MDRELIGWYANAMSMAIALACVVCVGTGLVVGALPEPNKMIMWTEVCMTWIASVVLVRKTYLAWELALECSKLEKLKRGD